MDKVRQQHGRMVCRRVQHVHSNLALACQLARTQHPLNEEPPSPTYIYIYIPHTTHATTHSHNISPHTDLIVNSGGGESRIEGNVSQQPSGTVQVAVEDRARNHQVLTADSQLNYVNRTRSCRQNNEQRKPRGRLENEKPGNCPSSKRQGHPGESERTDFRRPGSCRQEPPLLAIAHPRFGFAFPVCWCVCTTRQGDRGSVSEGDDIERQDKCVCVFECACVRKWIRFSA